MTDYLCDNQKDIQLSMKLLSSELPRTEDFRNLEFTLLRNGDVDMK